MTFFITGISTEVGKTIVSAIVVQALKADYWKPIQAGELDNSDTMKVQKLVSCETTTFFPNSYALKHPASPHLSAQMENIDISLAHIIRPKTNKPLVIEGAGGLLVPINSYQTIADLIAPTDKVIVVSRHYLGSINHTMLTIEALKRRHLSIAGIIFSGKENTATEQWLAENTQVQILGRIDEEKYFDKEIINNYAKSFASKLLHIQNQVNS